MSAPTPPGTPPPAGTPLATDGQGNVVTGTTRDLPSQRQWDRIWLIIVFTFAISYLLTVLALTVVFVGTSGRAVSGETLEKTYIFAAGVLAGVLARHSAT